MYAEQGYFTRAKKSKFAGEAGFSVVDVSDGIDKEQADFYIQSVGETIVFDETKSGEKWLYAALPSRRDGKLSVTRAFPTSDGRRICHFSHTYIFDNAAAKELLCTGVREAKAMRVTGFCGEYVGEPVGLESAVPEYNKEYAPEKIKFEDTGFTEDKMTALLNMIVLLHEHRNADKLLRGIFVVYECAADKFERKAFSLACLLYSCMPYDILSQLGVVIKTDSLWRKNESYPSGYVSAYMDNPRDVKNYIPGGELYILNAPLSNVTADICVITVRNDGNIKIGFPVKVEITPAYRQLFVDIVRYMKGGTGEAKSELHEFYKFAADIVGGVPSFRDTANLYQMAEALRDPVKAVKSGLKYAARILKLLNVSMEKNFDSADDYWKTQANTFILQLNFDLINGTFNEAPTEDVCLLILKVSLRLLYGTMPIFNSNFYKLLLKYNMLSLENDNLLNALTGEYEGILHTIIEMDKPNGYFLSFRDSLISRGGFDDIKMLLDYFDIYETPLDLEMPCHSRLYKTVSEFTDEQTEDVKNILMSREYVRGAVWTALDRLIEFKSFDTANARDTVMYFYSSGDWIEKELRIRAKSDSIYEAVIVKFYLYKVCAPLYEGDYGEFKENFRKTHSGFLKKNDREGLKSIKDFAGFMIGQRIRDDKSETNRNIREENKNLFRLCKYANFDEELWSMRWDEIVDAAYSAADNQLPDFANVFMNTFCKIAEDVNTGFDVYLNIYKILRERLLNPETNGIAKSFLDYSKSMFRMIDIYHPTEEDTEAEGQARFLIACLWGRASRIFGTSTRTVSEMPAMKAGFCPNCYCAVTFNNSAKCPVCKKKAPSDDTPYSLAELVTVDYETLKNCIKPDEDQNRKKSKDNAGDGGKFDFTNIDPNTAELVIKGFSDKAAEFFSLEKNFAERRRRTCLIVECSEDESDEAGIFEILEDEYFSYICLIKKQGGGLPELQGFRAKNKIDYSQVGKSKSWADACVSYYEDDFPAEMIKDFAQGVARYSALKLNCKIDMKL